MMNYTQQKAKADSADPKEIMESTVSSIVYFSMNWFIIQRFFGSIISGVIISAIGSAFLKNKK